MTAVRALFEGAFGIEYVRVPEVDEGVAVGVFWHSDTRGVELVVGGRQHIVAWFRHGSGYYDW